MSDRFRKFRAGLCMLFAIGCASVLAAQGVEVSAGYLLGNSPQVPAVAGSDCGDGFVLGTAVDLPLGPKVRLLLEPMYAQISDAVTTNRSKIFAAGLELGRPSKGCFQFGMARHWETLSGKKTPDQANNWAKVAFRIPGIIFPLPGAAPILATPFSDDQFMAFTRIEYSRALEQCSVGNTWQVSWAIGLRYSWAPE